MPNKTEQLKIAVIGGSGIYEMEGLSDVKELKVKTPFGNTSDAIIAGEIGKVSIAFLPRHGRGHRFLPNELPQKANIYALKSLGVETIISFSAVGSLKETISPGHFVMPDQLVDRTKNRQSTFFGNGIVAHVPFADPFCQSIQNILYEKAMSLGILSHKGGTVVCMEGPQFSTKAESEYHRNMGYSIIGMTICPEAKLAREAGICYAPVALVTDYDVWKEGQEVTAAAVIETLSKNVSNAKKLLAESIKAIAHFEKSCRCVEGAKQSIITEKKYIPKKEFEKIKLFID